MVSAGRIIWPLAGVYEVYLGGVGCDTNIRMRANDTNRANVAASFQKAAIDVLVYKTLKAAKEFKAKSIFLSGGVSANKLLRKTLKKETKKLKVIYSQPELKYTGDNAAMIALAGYYKWLKVKNLKSKVNFEAQSNLKIKNW